MKTIWACLADYGVAVNVNYTENLNKDEKFSGSFFACWAAPLDQNDEWLIHNRDGTFSSLSEVDLNDSFLEGNLLWHGRVDWRIFQGGWLEHRNLSEIEAISEVLKIAFHFAGKFANSTEIRELPNGTVIKQL